MTQALQNQIDRLYRRILMNVAPAKILATDDTGPIHRVQVNLNGGPEMIDQLAVMQHYGLNAHAPVGSDAAAMFIAGQRSNAVIVATNNQAARLRNLQPGEVALYTDEGDNLKFGRSQAVSLTAGNSFSATTKVATIKGTDSVTLDAPTTTVTQNLKAQGNVDASGGFFVNGVPIGSGDGDGGEPGPPGPAGPPGDAATIAVGTTVTGAAGTPAGVVNVGTPSAAVFDFTIPQGIQGVAGAMGATGSPGAAASIAVGTTTTGAPGTAAIVTNTGSSVAAVFNFTIPAGVAGAQGAQGNPGTPGAAGAAATIAVGTTTTGAAGTAAAVVNVGTPAAAVFNFTIPQGIQGATGATGPAGPPGTFQAGPGLSINPGTTPPTIDVATPYLPLAGGTISGTSTPLLAVNRNVLGSLVSPMPGAVLILQNADATGNHLQLNGFGSGGACGIVTQTASGTAASPTALAIANMLTLSARGYDGAAWSNNQAQINFQPVTVPWTTTDHSTRINFLTTPVGSTVQQTNMTLDGSGNLTLAGTLGCLQINAIGRQCRSGLSGATQGNYFNLDWVGGASNLWIDNTSIGVAFGIGSIALNNATSNWIAWNTAGIAAPTFTTRSLGTKLVLYPSLSGTATDYAIGIQSGVMWFSVGGGNYLWYNNTTQIMGLTSAGALSIASSLTLGAGINSTASGGVFTISGTPTITGMLSTPGGITSTANIVCSQAINPAANNASSVGSASVAWNQMNSYNWFTASDRREKTDIAPLPPCLDLVRAIEPKSYRWAEGEDERTHWGFVAQEVGEAMAGHDFGGHVVDAEGGPQRLAYNELVATLWQAVRELTARVEALA